jgi:cell division protein FtsL
MAGAVAERSPAARALPARQPRLRPLPGRPARPVVWLPSSLARRLIMFGICVAVLAGGRVALTFAVVQKNLQTTAVIAQQRAVREENMALAADVTAASATARVQRLAVTKYKLVPADNVQYLQVSGSGVKALGAPAP